MFLLAKTGGMAAFSSSSCSLSCLYRSTVQPKMLALLHDSLLYRQKMFWREPQPRLLVAWERMQQVCKGDRPTLLSGQIGIDPMGCPKSARTFLASHWLGRDNRTSGSAAQSSECNRKHTPLPRWNRRLHRARLGGYI